MIATAAAGADPVATAGMIPMTTTTAAGAAAMTMMMTTTTADLVAAATTKTTMMTMTIPAVAGAAIRNGLAMVSRRGVSWR
ncbi:hypothetical protein D3C71_1948380 [compost metagenome]